MSGEKKEITTKVPQKPEPMEPQISELVQFKIVEKEYAINVPKFVEITVEKPVYVNRTYEVPVIKEVEYEKPVVNLKDITEEMTRHLKHAVEVSLNEAIANLKFTYDIPMPKVMRVERKK